MKRWLIASLIAVLVFVTFSGAAWAVSMFIKNVAGLGQLNYTAAVGVDNIQVKSMTKVTVTVISTPQTVAGKSYFVDLYLDDVKLGSPQTVSWTGGQIPGHKIKLNFTTPNLTIITQIEAEVTE